ncbi:nuclear transport factor 2 family protein [Actinomycetospora sp. C-140]
MTSTDTSATSATPTTTNAATVAGIYTAFGRGDVPAILATLADDVAWDVWPRNFGQESGVEHLRARRGPADVAGFFGTIGTWTVRSFEVRDVIGTGDQVVAQIVADFDLPGGGRLHDDELHLWTFDDRGRVRAFRHYCDTAAHLAAQNGEDTSP